MPEASKTKHPPITLPIPVFARPEVKSASVVLFLLGVAYAMPGGVVGRSHAADAPLLSAISALILVWAYSVRARYTFLTFAAILFSRSLDVHASSLASGMLVECAFLTILYAVAGGLLRRWLGQNVTSIQGRELCIYLAIVIGLAAGLAALHTINVTGQQFALRDLLSLQTFDSLLGSLNGFLSVGAFFVLYAIPELRSDHEARADSVRLAPSHQRSRWLALLETLGQALVCIAGLWIVSSGLIGDHFNFFYLLFPPVVWIAVRQRLRGTLVALLGLNVGLSIVLQRVGGLPTAHSLMELQLFMLLLTVTGLVLANLSDGRKAAREDAIERSIYLRALLDNNPLAIVVHDRHGAVTLSNPAFQRIFGYGQDEVRGRSVDEIVRAPEEAQTETALTHTILAGKAVHVKTSRLRKDGMVLKVEFDGVPLFVEHRIAGGIAIYKDISDQARIDEEVLMSQKLKAVGQLAGGVAHDFNNILGVIQGYSEFVLDKMTDDASFREEVGEILSASKRATSLTRQLLAFSRKNVIQPRVIDLISNVNEMAKMLGRLIGEDIQMTISQSSDKARIKADPSQLEQVLINLVVNARDAMPKGGRLTIEIGEVKLHERYAASYAPVPPGSYVMMAVSDTGMGMSAETRAKIFDPFFTTKDKGKGTGLGLATVYGIVQQAGGHIRVDSEVGRGSAFRLFFPVLQGQDAALANDFQAGALFVRGTETILLVEDEVSLRKMMAKFLSGLGYTVLVAETPSEGVQTAQMYPSSIDLLLTDVVMPEFNGPQLAKLATTVRPEMKVLFMSGYTNGVLQQKELLADDFSLIHKPFSWNALSLKIRRLLDSDRVSGATHGADETEEKSNIEESVGHSKSSHP
jgi:PAS domain S-box-containing protein